MVLFLKAIFCHMVFSKSQIDIVGLRPQHDNIWAEEACISDSNNFIHFETLTKNHQNREGSLYFGKLIIIWWQIIKSCTAFEMTTNRFIGSWILIARDHIDLPQCPPTCGTVLFLTQKRYHSTQGSLHLRFE